MSACRQGVSSFISVYFLLAIIPILFLLSCHRPENGMAPMNSDKPVFTLSEAQMQLANIKVAEATTGALGHQLLLTGVLKVDEQSLVSISSSSNGRIEKLFFRNTGDRIKKGDPLYEIYSEDLLEIQKKYKAMHDNRWNYYGKVDETQTIGNKLLLLGMLPAQIEKIKTTKNLESVITIYSQREGIIRSVNVTEGQYVSAGEQIFELADDNVIWVEAQAYPNELPFLSVGMPADVIVPNAENLHVRNQISFINPAFEPGSNVILVRAIIDNHDKKLYPGMLALLSVETQKSQGIVIPASALLYEKDGSLVWVQNNDGSFASRKVTTGIQSSDSVLITSGIEEYEKVVVSGVYLLNSENILNKWTGSGTETGM